MSPIYAITKLATLVMVIDNDADQEELDILNKLPQRMAAHIEDRSGVTISISISIGDKKSSKSFDDMNKESEHSISTEEISEIANQTIQEYNETDQDDVDDWIKGIADSIVNEDLRFQTLRMLCDMTAADGEILDEEINILEGIAVHWTLKEDLSDFLFMKTKEEWIWKKNKLLRP
tara:strand:+ start:2021 stop:2548 length:528 start_codon:yes stop_codon:yes gene_type:complete